MSVAAWLSRQYADKDLQPAQMVRRGDQARDARDWVSAARDYAAAIELGAERLEIYVQLGHALKELGRFPEAERAYHIFLQARPFDADIHLQIGHLFNKQGDLAVAAEWYERAAQLSPTDPEIVRHVDLARSGKDRSGVAARREQAMDQVAKRKWSEAERILTELVESDGQEDLVGVWANVTKETGDFARAAERYERYRMYAASKEPSLLPDVELQSGHLRKASGDYRSALRHFIGARRHHIRATDDFEGTSTYDNEIMSCVQEIYTCFWDRRSA